jgi:putative ABC transport system permease protein
VLRAEVAPLPAPRMVRVLAAGVLIASVLLAAYVQTGELRVALFFSAGIAALAAVLWLAARGLMRAIASLPRQRLPVIAWHGAAALTRPSAGTTGSIVALGMGTLVVLGVALIEGVLAREVAHALPKDAPSVFLVDVQPEQWPEAERIVRAHRGTQIQSVPVIMARLKAVGARTVDALVAEREAAAGVSPSGQRDRARGEGRPRGMLTREQRITMLQTLPPSNEVVAGALWSRPDIDNEISLEQDFARDLGATLGSRLTFDVQGVPIEFLVTSLRRVEWRSFSVNFFLVAEPDGPLADAPRFVLGAARIPAELEQRAQNELAERMPNVTVMRMRAMIERASELLAQVATAVRLIGAFAALTGLVILAGAVASTQLRRSREAALLKALGVTRARVAGLFAVEYALTGGVAAFMAAFGAYGLTWSFASYVLELSSAPSWIACVVGFFVIVALSVGAGLLASARALRAPPLAAFRE